MKQSLHLSAQVKIEKPEGAISIMPKFCPKCGGKEIEPDRNPDNEPITNKFYCYKCKFRGWILEKETFSEFG